jgi:hypothetical protein
VHAIDRQVPTDQGKQLLWKVKQALNLAGLKPEDLWEDYVGAAVSAVSNATVCMGDHQGGKDVRDRSS